MVLEITMIALMMTVMVDNDDDAYDGAFILYVIRDDDRRFIFYVKFLKSLYYRVYQSVYMIYLSNQSINQSITTEDRSKIENSCCFVEYHKTIYHL